MDEYFLFSFKLSNSNADVGLRKLFSPRVDVGRSISSLCSVKRVDEN